MASRLDLQQELETLLDNRNVYFQPPPSLLMKYDAIRYELAEKYTKRANNHTYLIVNKYEGVVITHDSETDIPDKMLMHFQMISFGKSYVADNLYHFPFTLYY